MFDISDRVAVVTGASSGIGLFIAETLADAGTKVVLLARRKDLLSRETKRLAERGGAVDWVAADLTDRDGIGDCCERVVTCFGAPQIVVNAAGINLREGYDKVSWDSWDATINLNLTTPFFFARHFIDSMIENGWGRVVNVASLQSTRAFANSIAYGASKGGVTQLTRAMAECWSPHGIMCNAIAPGFFPTALTAPVFDNPDAMNDMASRTAIGRNGEMADLRGPVIFLISPASDYVTGQVLYIDGGFTAK
ncbi:MAG: SDR family oxidoreductase [Acidiferrobacterales bacterium]|nr:SDR family oxidoreductase [Acidiferrobacterales bacterium]